MTLIRGQLARLAQIRLAAGRQWNAAGLLFPDPATGEPTSPHAFTLRKLRLTKAAGISSAPSATHGLRHSHARALLESGVEVSTLTRRLGHSSEKVTLTTYVRATSTMDESSAETTETVFGPAAADLDADPGSRHGKKLP